MNPREMLEFLGTSKILVHCTDQLRTAQWFLQETQDAANYPEYQLDPEMKMSVSHLTVKQGLFFAKMNSHLFNYTHEMRPVPLEQMFLVEEDRWWVRKQELDLWNTPVSNPFSRDNADREEFHKKEPTSNKAIQDAMRSDGNRSYGAFMIPGNCTSHPSATRTCQR